MTSSREISWTIAITLAAAYGVPKLLRFMFGKIDIRDLLFGDRQQREEKPGVVYLHMFPRSVARQVVNLSPFAVKLETWLRLRKLPYEVGARLYFWLNTFQVLVWIMAWRWICNKQLFGPVIIQRIMSAFTCRDILLRFCTLCGCVREARSFIYIYI